VGGYTLPGYTAFYTVLLNLALAGLLTPVLNRFSIHDPVDETVLADYSA
jgi:solute:Na+ symporter, SSS family